MGEIKSTLDLVMEKTRHLSLTQEEKMAQAKDEVLKKLKGLLLKYQEAAIRKDQLIKRVDSLRDDYELSDNTIIINSIKDQIGLDTDCRKFLELLEALFESDVKPLALIIEDYQAAIKSLFKNRSQQILDELYQKKAISGSAVVPNLEADEQSIQAAEEIKSKFVKRLEKEKQKLIES